MVHWKCGDSRTHMHLCVCNAGQFQISNALEHCIHWRTHTHAMDTETNHPNSLNQWATCMQSKRCPFMQLNLRLLSFFHSSLLDFSHNFNHSVNLNNTLAIGTIIYFAKLCILFSNASKQSNHSTDSCCLAVAWFFKRFARFVHTRTFSQLIALQWGKTTNNNCNGITRSNGSSNDDDDGWRWWSVRFCPHNLANQFTSTKRCSSMSMCVVCCVVYAQFYKPNQTRHERRNKQTIKRIKMAAPVIFAPIDYFTLFCFQCSNKSER